MRLENSFLPLVYILILLNRTTCNKVFPIGLNSKLSKSWHIVKMQYATGNTGTYICNLLFVISRTE